MSSHRGITAEMFELGSASDHAAAVNRELLASLIAMGWSFPPASVDVLRAMGDGDEHHRSPEAYSLAVPTAAGEVLLRVLESSDPTGLYLFMHPGGWAFGSADGHDAELERVVEETKMTAVSVEYRLAPEDPYPAGLDDCEHAARWLLANGEAHLGSGRLVIGGASAGANLALCTMLRLKASGSLGRVAGASLLYGNYDLTMTPSQRGAAADRSIVSTEALEWLYDRYVPDHSRRADPDVSPLYGDLHGLPPTLLSVGSADSLIDDTLFLASRMLAAGVPCELQVVPGGEHAFDMLPIPSSQDAVGRIHEFLGAVAGATTSQPRGES